VRCSERASRRAGLKLTWLCGHGYIGAMKSIAAGKFKDVCLKTLDEVASTKSTVVITKRGRPVAKLVPYVGPAKKGGLAGSVLKEVGDPFCTGERWEADADTP
jgi:antitoxin (DNA-binding transcriptional repressor) of toxin-antitoxin stability system